MICGQNRVQDKPAQLISAERKGGPVGKEGSFHQWCWGSHVSTCKRTKRDLASFPIKINYKS